MPSTNRRTEHFFSHSSSRPGKFSRKKRRSDLQKTANAVNERRRMWRLAGKYSATGIEMAMSVAVGAIGGRWLDTQFETEPWLLTAGILIGFWLATRTVIRVVKQYQRDLERERS